MSLITLLFMVSKIKKIRLGAGGSGKGIGEARNIARNNTAINDYAHTRT